MILHPHVGTALLHLGSIWGLKFLFWQDLGTNNCPEQQGLESPILQDGSELSWGCADSTANLSCSLTLHTQPCFVGTILSPQKFAFALKCGYKAEVGQDLPARTAPCTVHKTLTCFTLPGHWGNFSLGLCLPKDHEILMERQKRKTMTKPRTWSRKG